MSDLVRILVVICLLFPYVALQQSCSHGRTKQWRFDMDIEVPTCLFPNGSEIVQPIQISLEDADDIIAMYPGLLQTEDEISQLPLSSDFSFISLDPQTSRAPVASVPELPPGILNRTAEVLTTTNTPTPPRRTTPGLEPNLGGGHAANTRTVTGVSRSAARAPSAARAGAIAGCCEVDRSMNKYATLVNSYGVLRTIVNFPQRDVYQYVNVGRCRNPDSPCAVGICKTEQATRFLAVFLPEQGENVIGFEPFSIDNHCVCVNVRGK